MAFAFATKRKAILLVAGDKSGITEKRFYRTLVRKADERFESHLVRFEEEGKEIMAVNVEDKIRKLSTVQRKKVEVRAAELIAEEMTLRELRKARKLTQACLTRTRRSAADQAGETGRGDRRQPVPGRSDV